MFYYDVFNEKVGTISSFTSFEEAHKSAKKYAKKMDYYFVVFKRFPSGSQELVKWVFPRKK